MPPPNLKLHPTLCLVMSRKDLEWLNPLIKTEENLVVVAVSFEAKLSLLEAKIPFHDIETPTNVNKSELFDQARLLTHQWLQTTPDISSSLLSMYQSHLLLILFEALQSRKVVETLINQFHPKRVITSRDKAEGILSILRSDRGLERESLEVLCRERNITLTLHQASQPEPPVPRVDNNFLLLFWFRKWLKLTRDYQQPVLYGAGQHTQWLLTWLKKADFSLPKFIIDDQAEEGQKMLGVPVIKTSLAEEFDAVVISSDGHPQKMADNFLNQWPNANVILPYSDLPPGPYYKELPQPAPQINFDADNDGSKILFFVWGDYYFQQFTPVLAKLIDRQCQVTVVLIGGSVTSGVIQKFEEKGVIIKHKNDWPYPYDVQAKTEFQLKKDEDEILRETTGHTGHQPSLDYYRFQLHHCMPSTAATMERCRSILKQLQPDVVINHFAMAPDEVAYVLPAREMGIPTLGLSHGILSTFEAPRETFATEYFASPGEVFSQQLIQCTGFDQEKTFLIGECRMGNIQLTEDRRQAKRQMGFDPDRPLTIFCDNSMWNHSGVNKHSTWETVQQVIGLKEKFPELQIVIRLHPGPLYEDVVQGFNAVLATDDIKIQAANKPVFLDAVKGADFVIAHAGSAICESLMSGVEVIYLEALCAADPIYGKAEEELRIVRDFTQLPDAINAILTAPKKAAEVKASATSLLNRLINCDLNQAPEELARVILELVGKKSEPNYQDWLKRLEFAANYKSA